MSGPLGNEADAAVRLDGPPVAVVPISKDQAGYGADVLSAFEDAGIRAVAYDGADTLSRRMRWRCR